MPHGATRKVGEAYFVLCKSISGIKLSLLMPVISPSDVFLFFFYYLFIPPLLCVGMVYSITVHSASLYFPL